MSLPEWVQGDSGAWGAWTVASPSLMVTSPLMTMLGSGGKRRAIVDWRFIQATTARTMPMTT